MVPAGGGLAPATRALAEPGSIERHAREAAGWVQGAIAVVKSAPDNHHGDDDEAIAGEILRRIDERKQAGRPAKL
jgi:hypothetical protein